MAENQKIQQIDCTKVPEPTLRRLPWYLSNVKLLKQRGERFVSSTQISKEINIDASQIAKDLSYVNISGRTRVGYEVDALIEVLEHFLGFTEIHKAFLFGVGSLGGALLQDSGLKHFGLEIVAAFDVDPTLVGTNLNGIPIYHSDDFLKKMEEYDVQIGVLTVPIEIAQCITDMMVDGGIKAVWNFTPFRIRVPEDIVVQNTSLYAHLAVMFNRLNFNQIMKIIAVGMNYALHNQELGHTSVNKEPVIFMKPDSAILKDGKPFFIPDFSNEVHYETELVVRINRLGKNISPRFASRYYDALTVGIDFTARDLQRKFREAGNPWELCKGFDSSAAIGTFVPVDRYKDIQSLNFNLMIDGKEVQRGCTADMLFKVDDIIAYVSKFVTLKIGDLLFTGTPAGVGPVSIGQHLQGYLEGEKLLDFYIR